MGFLFSDDNEEAKKDPHFEAYQTDRNAYEYGGREGGARNYDAQMAHLRGQAMAREQQQRDHAHEYAQQQRNLYNYGVSGLDQANQSRGAQMDAMGLARARAYGGDLISQQIARQQGQQLQAQQASAAAGARGPAALALAQQNAANNTATGQSQIANQAMIAGAQERLANQQAYAQQAAGLRGADVGQSQMAFGAGAQAGGLGAQQAQIGLGYGQLGLGYTGQQMGVNQAQLAAQMQREAQNSANYNAAKGVQAGAEAQNSQQNTANNMAVLAGLANAMSSSMGSDERMKNVAEEDDDVSPTKYQGKGNAQAPAQMFSSKVKPSATHGGFTDAMAEVGLANPWHTRSDFAKFAPMNYQAPAAPELPTLPSDERAKRGLAEHAPMAEANRSQKGFAYTYKPEYTPPEQAPGERNFGPMAQNMAGDPIARTAVRQGPDGMLSLDLAKLSKVQSAGIASLQGQVDELRGALSRARKKDEAAE